jgi:hypothetical protein
VSTTVRLTPHGKALLHALIILAEPCLGGIYDSPAPRCMPAKTLEIKAGRGHARVSLPHQQVAIPGKK